MDKSSEAELLNRQAVQLQAMGRARESLDSFQKAAVLFHEVGDLAGEGRCLNGVGALFKDLGEPGKAIGPLEQALALRRATRDIRGEAITLTTLGPVYQSLGRPEEARSYLNRALSLIRWTNDRAREGQVLFNLGEIAFVTGDLPSALKRFEEALEIAREEGDPFEELKCIDLLGQTSIQAGRLHEGLSLCQQALKLAQEMGNPIAISCSLHGMGLAYCELGQTEQALKAFEVSLEFDKRTGATGMSPETLSSIAYICLQSEELRPRAAMCLEEALSLARESGDTYGLADALLTHAHLCLSLNRLEEAQQSLTEATSLAKKSGSLTKEATILTYLGSLHREETRTAEAMDEMRRAVALYRQAGNRPGEARALHNLATIFDEGGEKEEAFKYFEAATRVFDSLRLETGGEHRISYFDKREVQNTYKVYASRLTEAFRERSDPRYAERAFHVSERRRTRALREFLQNRLLSGPAADGEGLLEEWSRASARLQATRSALDDRELPDEVRARLLQEQEDLQDERLRLEEGFFRLDPRHAGLARLDAVTMQQVRDEILGPDEALLEYSLHLDRTLLWIITHESFETFKLPGVSEVRALVSQLRKAVTVRDPDLHRISNRLYAAILEPARERIEGKDLIVVPDDTLLILPFQLLVTDPDARTGGASFLGRQHVIRYAPSATVLTVLKSAAPRPAQSLDLAAFAPVDFPGLPARQGGRLPYSRAEVESISALFPAGRTQTYIGRAARKSSALSPSIETARFLHFATHGLLDVIRAESSALLLRDEDGRPVPLHAGEIANLRLQADLVVLSACESGLGAASHGEGILGLTRAFFYAGANAVCASLWSVYDDSTAELMKNFYQKVVDGLQPAKALQKAQIELMDSPLGRSPIEWAPFILIG